MSYCEEKGYTKDGDTKNDTRCNARRRLDFYSCAFNTDICKQTDRPCLPFYGSNVSVIYPALDAVPEVGAISQATFVELGEFGKFGGFGILGTWGRPNKKDTSALGPEPTNCCLTYQQLGGHKACVQGPLGLTSVQLGYLDETLSQASRPPHHHRFNRNTADGYVRRCDPRRFHCNMHVDYWFLIISH